MPTYLIKTNEGDSTVEAESVEHRDGIAYFLDANGQEVTAGALRNISYCLASEYVPPVEAVADPVETAVETPEESPVVIPDLVGEQ